MISKKQVTKLEFTIKLLSGNNIVLLEAKGYESEIFMPELLNGRLTFQNVIPNRRCCYMKDEQMRSNISNGSSHSVGKRKPLTPTNSKVVRIQAGQDSSLKSYDGDSLAFKTPAAKHKNIGTQSQPMHDLGDENLTHSNLQVRCSSTINSSSTQSSQTPLPSPEMARCMPHKILKHPLIKIPSGVKVKRLYRNPTTDSPKKLGRIVGTNKGMPMTSTPTKQSSQTVNMSSIRLPATPDMSDKRSNKFVGTRKILSTPGSVTKWRHCLTPIRTYSRRSLISAQKHSRNSNCKNSAQTNVKKVIPTFLVNPSQCPKANKKTELRKRKLVVDPKTAISPYSFKKQLLRKSIKKEGYISASKLPKTNRDYERSKPSAFDLLTNSNRMRCMANALNVQFRKSCINKASATNPKYKVLCAVPPLESERTHN